MVRPLTQMNQDIMATLSRDNAELLVMASLSLPHATKVHKLVPVSHIEQDGAIFAVDVQTTPTDDDCTPGALFELEDIISVPSGVRTIGVSLNGSLRIIVPTHMPEMA